MLRAARAFAAEAGDDPRLLTAIAVEEYLQGDEGAAREPAEKAQAVLKDQPCELAKTRADLAEALRLAGMTADAARLRKAALAEVRKAGPDERRLCVDGLGRTQARSGDLDGALATIEHLPKEHRSMLLADVVFEMAGQGRYDEALRHAGQDLLGVHAALGARAEGPRWREAQEAFTLRMGRPSTSLLSNAAMQAALARDFAKVGEIDALQGILGPAGAAIIASHRARHGDIDDAIRYATAAIEGAGAQAEVLIDISDILERRGLPGRAGLTREHALEVSARDPDQYAVLLRQLRVFLREGLTDEVLSLLNALPEERRGTAAGSLAEDMARAGRLEDAVRVAALVPQGAESRFDREAAYCLLAEKQARRGDVPGALASLERLGASPRVDMETRPRVARAFARLGRVSDGLKVLSHEGQAGEARVAFIESMAEEEARIAVRGTYPDWIAGLRYPREKAHAWLGAARGWRLHSPD